MGKRFFTVAGLFTLAYLITGQSAVSMTNLNYIIPDQGPSIYELGQIVRSDPVTAGYHYEDYCLAAWLANNDFDVAKAFEDIRAYAFWRKEEGIDSILSENFEDMHSYFPYNVDTHDPEGRPVIYINLGQWDINRYAVQSDAQKARFARYLAKMLEEGNTRVQQLYSQGYRNVTQYSFIVNMEGFSVEKHLSLGALQLYRTVTGNVCDKFPYVSERCILINTPYLFTTAYGYLDEDIKKFMSFYDHPSVYEPALVDYLGVENIPRDLLPLKTYNNGAPCRMY